MFEEYKDIGIPLLDKPNGKELFHSKSKLFISDCLYIRNIISHPNNTFAFDFDKSQMELESYFASLNVQIEVIEEMIVKSINSNISTFEYIESIINDLESEVIKLNQSYKTEYTLYAAQGKKAAELTQSNVIFTYLNSLIELNTIEETERESTETRDTNCSNDNFQYIDHSQLDIGNKNINAFMHQIAETIKRIKKLTPITSCTNNISQLKLKTHFSNCTEEEEGYVEISNNQMPNSNRKQMIIGIIVSVLLVMIVICFYM